LAELARGTHPVTPPAVAQEECVSTLEYEISVSGELPASVLDEVEDFTVEVVPVRTIMRGPVADQAALHGIINRLQSLGLDLIEVRRIGELTD
jgi:hypothetical protein